MDLRRTRRRADQARALVRRGSGAPTRGTPADYTWTNVKPGTYLYQSGTQPQVQVQMGLYGAVTKNAVDVVTGPTPVRGQAYAATATQAAAAFQYDNQATLLYSEIDPDLHVAAIVDRRPPTYGTPPARPARSTTRRSTS